MLENSEAFQVSETGLATDRESTASSRMMMTLNASRMSAPASMSSTTSSIEVREHCATTSGGVASMYAWAQATHDTTATVSNASSQMVASCCLRAKVSLPAKQMPM